MDGWKERTSFVLSAMVIVMIVFIVGVNMGHDAAMAGRPKMEVVAHIINAKAFEAVEKLVVK